MPSKKKKGGKDDIGAERAPLQPVNDATAVQSQSDALDACTEEVSMDKLPISIAPIHCDTYQDPVAFDENEDEQYSQSIFFGKNDNGLFVNLLDGYDWYSISKYLDEKHNIKVASQLTVENANDGGTINFISYSKISFSNQLSAIYQLVIQLLQSMKRTTSDDDANENQSNDIVYPWNLIFPQNPKTGLPILSQNGLYFVKLFFCGQWRTVLIDDHVPMFDGKFLFPTIAESNEIWSQLLTKAILKFLILSNRLNDELCVPLIVQLLTSFIPMTVSQLKSMRDANKNVVFVANLDEKTKMKKAIQLDSIEDWTITTTLNNFVISDEIIENQDCWVIASFSDYNQQNVEDLWTNQEDKIYTNDKTVIISKNETDIDVILQINSLNKNLSEKVSLFVYDEKNNIKKVVESVNMQNGFGTITASIRPYHVYFIEVDGNISYSVTVYSTSSNLYLSPRFGDDKIWQMVDRKMVHIQSESGNHSISQTFILFNIHIKVMSASCDILFHSTFNNKLLGNSLILYCVNLDDQSMQFIPNLTLSKFNIKQNQNGYSLIAFSRPTHMINNSKYEMKIIYNGDMEHTVIDMKSILDFRINYIHNFEAALMKDEIISDDGAKFMFSEIYFEAQDNYQDFGKIIQFIDKDTEQVIAKYTSTQSILYVPQMFIGDAKLWFNVKFDKSNPGPDQHKLYKDNSVQCTVRVISDEKIRLFPDNSQQLKFEEIKQSWQTAKGRADTARQTRQKFLEKQTENQAPKNYNVNIKKSQDVPPIVVDDAFWSQDGETKSELLKQNSEQIENEQQFRNKQHTKINDHNSYIQEIQKSSFTNTQQFSNQDKEKRGELRNERLEWNEKLSLMNKLNDEMQLNFDDFKTALATFNAEIDKMVEDTKNAEPTKTPKGKKGGKGKGKSKSKISKPSTDIILPQDIPKLLQQCQEIEQTVPKWCYGSKIDECNTKMNSILHDLIIQCNTQFSALIHYKIKLKQLDDDSFKECCDKYIKLCLAIYEQIAVITKWKKLVSWHTKLVDAQNQSDDIITRSVFSKLQSLIPMTSENEPKDVDMAENEESANEATEPSKEEEELVTKVTTYLVEIQFVSDAKQKILVQEHEIIMKQMYIDYMFQVQQWIEQRQQNQQEISQDDK